MTYEEFLERDHFSKEELLAFSYGRLIQNVPGEIARMPAPPFLMVDRVLEVERGTRGRIVGEKDIAIDDWYFQCHFLGDPVQPGCLSVDAVWQLLGFYCVLNGSLGSGRALGCKETAFDGQIRPYDRVVRYEIEVRRYTAMETKGAALAIGNAEVSVDGEVILTMKDAKVGIFTGIKYDDYPAPSRHSKGGILKRS